MKKSIIAFIILILSYAANAQNENSFLKIDTFVNKSCGYKVESNINSILQNLKYISNSELISDKLNYIKGSLKAFDEDLKTDKFSKANIVVAAFLEKFETDDDDDYVGIFELHFLNEKQSIAAFQKLYKYDGYFGSSIIYHDWVFIRSNKLIYIIESLPKTKNYILKDDILQIIKNDIKIDEYKQRQ